MVGKETLRSNDEDHVPPYCEKDCPQAVACSSLYLTILTIGRCNSTPGLRDVYSSGCLWTIWSVAHHHQNKTCRACCIRSRRIR